MRMRNAALLALALATVPEVSMAQAQDREIAARNRAAVEAAFEEWRNGTGSPFALLTEDATWIITGRSAAAGTYDGREVFLREVIRPFNARMKAPLRPTVRRIFTDGDAVVVLFDAKGVANDGMPYTNTYAWFLTLQDGRVVRAVAFFDSIEFDDLWTRVTPGVPPSPGR